MTVANRRAVLWVLEKVLGPVGELVDLTDEGPLVDQVIGDCPKLGELGHNLRMLEVVSDKRFIRATRCPTCRMAFFQEVPHARS